MFAYRIIKHKIFEICALIIIVINSIDLALDDPLTNKQPGSQTNLETFFLVAYTIEAVLKICGLGFLFNKSF